ncbi:MAG: ATP-binding cassette domain-containing protein [Deltaproteobacteria bacterium]|nr:ATP-binding cassette domain-containing protein [Deltaproteobacteria bacterium]
MPWPINVANYSLCFPHKVCFENFSTSIYYGERIAIAGRNGSGKSSLLQMLSEANRDLRLARIPQTIADFENLSGGERFNRALSLALGEKPDLLLLDEPTNHLDQRNRRNLWRLLKSYPGTLIVATHDRELLRNFPEIIWLIKGGRITVFRGSYDDYEREAEFTRQSILRRADLLKRQKATLHQNLMLEQERAARSRAAGEKKSARKKWTKMAGNLKKMRAEKSRGGALQALGRKREDLSAQLAELRPPEIIKPRFQLDSKTAGDAIVVSVRDGSAGYPGRTVLNNVNLDVGSRKRLALTGPNGSGKTTLLRAIIREADVIRGGHWRTPQPESIGYLDQHYRNLDPRRSALEIIAEANPNWTGIEIRKHLSDFLFRQNREVETAAAFLSGGERLRLSLANIAARPPKLLLLDEITNNIDLETRRHVGAILSRYPAAMILISHDEDFLAEIEAEKWDVLAGQ